MDMSTYRRLVEMIGFGKKLPSAIYTLRQPSGKLPAETGALVARAEIAAQPAHDWNLLKLHLERSRSPFSATRTSMPIRIPLSRGDQDQSEHRVDSRAPTTARARTLRFSIAKKLSAAR